MWQWAYPYGGGIYDFMSCYKCSREHLRRITDLSKVRETTVAMTERLSKFPEPAMNPHLYRKVIDAKAVVVLQTRVTGYYIEKRHGCWNSVTLGAF